MERAALAAAKAKCAAECVASDMPAATTSRPVCSVYARIPELEEQIVVLEAQEELERVLTKRKKKKTKRK